MEKFALKKNIILGSALLCWPFALALLLSEKDAFTKDELRTVVCGLITTVLFVICAIIPIIGWIAEIALLVFLILALVNIFKGNLDYKMIIVSKMAYWFIKD